MINVRKDNSRPIMYSAPVAVHIVVESQFFVLLDIPAGKNAHAYVAPDGPFCNIAIRAAAVVGEAPDASAFSGVYKLRHQKVVSNETVKGWRTNLILLKHHKVEVFEALGSVVAHSLLE